MLRMSLVQSKSFEDKTGSLVRSFIVKLDEPCRRIEPPYRCVLKSAEHNIRVIALPQEIVNCGPLKSGPWLLIVIWADNHDHKVGVVIVKIRKINAKVASRKLCFMKFVIEDFLLAKALRENSCYLIYKMAYLPCKGQRDTKASDASADGGVSDSKAFGDDAEFPNLFLDDFVVNCQVPSLESRGDSVVKKGKEDLPDEWRLLNTQKRPQAVGLGLSTLKEAALVSYIDPVSGEEVGESPV